MQSSSMRRIVTNLSFLRNFKKDFCQKEVNEPKEYDHVLYKEHNPNVFEINLNQPKKLNSLDLRMIKSMLKYVRKWIPENINTTGEEDNTTENTPGENIPKVLLLTGNGKHFCAGGDIRSLYQAKKSGENLKILNDFFRYEYLLDYSLTRVDPLLIALWNGYVMGGGVGLSINAPIRVATDSTVFAMPGKFLLIP
jgi:enoyl-CoA hydratase/carnithine racemase